MSDEELEQTGFRDADAPHAEVAQDASPEEIEAERNRELVDAALVGAPGPRAVLAGHLGAIPLEVARRVGGDESAFRVEVRAQLSLAVAALNSYDGSEPLDVWARRRVEAAVPMAESAANPQALADTIDVETWITRETGVPVRSASPSGGLSWRQLPLVGIVALLLLFMWKDPDIGDDPDAVRGGDVRVLSPVGEVVDWDAFSWSADDSDGYAARVVVMTPTGVVRGPLVEEGLWTPTEAQISAFGDRIRWQVIETTGGTERRGWGRAWLVAR